MYWGEGSNELFSKRFVRKDDFLDFSSEHVEWNLTKLNRKQWPNVDCQVCFWPDRVRNGAKYITDSIHLIESSLVVYVYWWERIISLCSGNACLMFVKLGMDKVLIVPYTLSYLSPNCPVLICWHHFEFSSTVSWILRALDRKPVRHALY